MCYNRFKDIRIEQKRRCCKAPFDTKLVIDNSATNHNIHNLSCTVTLRMQSLYYFLCPNLKKGVLIMKLKWTKAHKSAEKSFIREKKSNRNTGEPRC